MLAGEILHFVITIQRLLPDFQFFFTKSLDFKDWLKDHWEISSQWTSEVHLACTIQVISMIYNFSSDSFYYYIIIILSMCFFMVKSKFLSILLMSCDSSNATWYSLNILDLSSKKVFFLVCLVYKFTDLRFSKFYIMCMGRKRSLIMVSV